MNVLLWGLAQDGPLAAVRRELRRAGVEPLLIDQRRPEQAAIELITTDTVSGTLHLPGRTVALEQIDAAYLRPYNVRQLHDQNGAPDARWTHAHAVGEAVTAWASITPARVVSRPAAMASNESKPYQLGLIRSAGFAVPPTLITTDPDAARRFIERHGRVIYKSISGIRSRVAQLSPARAKRLDDVAWCPTQLQRYIEGVDHRVHVAGTQVFASRVMSTADDYRYADAPPKITATALPPEIERRCVDLAASLELPLAGIDLRLTPQGEWCCFEVNPSPAFIYYEAATGQPIANAVARLLIDRR